MNDFSTPIPEVGKCYHFFDDGKISYSRHYMAVVNEILTKDQIKNILVDRTGFFDKEYEDYDTYEFKKSLYDVWVEEKTNCDFLYAYDTDYIIKCSVPEYDNDPLYFVRTKIGGWFSMDVTNTWQSGELDVTGKLFKILEETLRSKRTR